MKYFCLGFDRIEKCMEPTAVKAVTQTIAADSQQSDSHGGEEDRNRMKEGVLLSFSKLLV